MPHCSSKSETHVFREGEDMIDPAYAPEPTTHAYICRNIEGRCVRALTGGRFFKFDRGEGLCESCGKQATPDTSAIRRTD
jgi:hypothetical protein